MKRNFPLPFSLILSCWQVTWRGYLGMNHQMLLSECGVGLCGAGFHGGLFSLELILFSLHGWLEWDVFCFRLFDIRQTAWGGSKSRRCLCYQNNCIINYFVIVGEVREIWSFEWRKSSHDLNGRGVIACTNNPLTLFRRSESAGLGRLHHWYIEECQPSRMVLSQLPRGAFPSNFCQKFPIHSLSCMDHASAPQLHLNQFISVDLDVTIPSIHLSSNTAPPNFSWCSGFRVEVRRGVRWCRAG